jgi:hypothetical protein
VTDSTQRDLRAEREPSAIRGLAGHIVLDDLDPCATAPARSNTELDAEDVDTITHPLAERCLAEANMTRYGGMLDRYFPPWR